MLTNGGENAEHFTSCLEPVTWQRRLVFSGKRTEKVQRKSQTGMLEKFGQEPSQSLGILLKDRPFKILQAAKG